MTVRDNNPQPDNRLGIDGIEFIEYATSRPLALGMLLEQMGFVATARQRSREVTLYRQGGMNLIVNADPRTLPLSDSDAQTTEISAIALRASGVRVTGIQVMRDFEGLSGALHEYKLDIARNLLQVCKAVGAPLLLVCSSTSAHASGELSVTARHLAKLATLAVPLGVRIGYEALSWGRHVNQYAQAWDAVELADHANLGVVLDSFHLLANQADFDALEDIPGHKTGAPDDGLSPRTRECRGDLQASQAIHQCTGSGSGMRLDEFAYPGANHFAPAAT